jgi:hypothetical protein
MLGFIFVMVHSVFQSMFLVINYASVWKDESNESRNAGGKQREHARE